MTTRKWLAVLCAVIIAAIGMQSAMAEPAIQEPAVAAAQDAVNAAREKMEADQDKYAPQVRTLTNGVKVQLAPDTAEWGVLTDKLGYNEKFLNADNRGCAACHFDLADTVAAMDEYPHLVMNVGVEVDMAVWQCMACHDCNGSVPESAAFGSLIHAIHSSRNKGFDAVGGDCWSCHYATEDGKAMQLWDDVKHDVVRGISTISAEEAQNEMMFSWEQDTVLDYENTENPIFNVNWIGDDQCTARHFAGEAGLLPEPETDGVYDVWTIEVTGLVEKPFTMTLSELIETFGVKSDKMTQHCADNVIGGPWVGNYEIKGIDLNDILEYAGLKENANVIRTYGGGGSKYHPRRSFIEENGGYIVLEVAGKPLPYHLGYPAQVWVGGEAAWSCVKEVFKIEAIEADYESPEFPAWAFNSGWEDENGISYFKPNVGLVNFKEGQIIEAGKPFEFEGFASSWDVGTDAIEFSFDRGETWMRCDTTGSNLKNWVYWHLTWNNPQPGAYTIQVRAIGRDGTVTYRPLDFLVNVQ